jgi:hypothetical protein
MRAVAAAAVVVVLDRSIGCFPLSSDRDVHVLPSGGNTPHIGMEMIRVRSIDPAFGS